MQIHGPSEIIKDGSRVSVELNPGGGSPFADMRIGPVRLYIDTPEECDWLIAAAAEAKRLLSPPPQGSHPYDPCTDGFPSIWYCERCDTRHDTACPEEPAPVPHVHKMGDDGCIAPGCGLTLADWAAQVQL